MDDEVLEALPVPVLAALVRDLRTALTRAEARIAALEAGLAGRRGGGPPVPPKKTPATSSLPPAMGWKARRATPAAGSARPKRGPKPGHAGTSRRRAGRDQLDVVLPCRPQACDRCGAALPAWGGTVVGRRQVTAIPPVRPVVIEARRVGVRGRRCRYGTVGRYPDGFGATGAFG